MNRWGLGAIAFVLALAGAYAVWQQRRASFLESEKDRLQGVVSALETLRDSQAQRINALDAKAASLHQGNVAKQKAYDALPMPVGAVLPTVEARQALPGARAIEPSDYGQLYPDCVAKVEAADQLIKGLNMEGDVLRQSIEARDMQLKNAYDEVDAQKAVTDVMLRKLEAQDSRLETMKWKSWGFGIAGVLVSILVRH